jgi:cation transport regulator ChaB
MRYKSVNDLPEVLRDLLPNKEAQQVYLDAYNETWDTYQ